MIHICKYCNTLLEYSKENKKDLATHYWNKHRVEIKRDYRKIKPFICKEFYNDEIPLCECGCNETVDYYIPGKNIWAHFKRGHFVRVVGNNPTRDNVESARKALTNRWKTVRRQFENGEREFLMTPKTKEWKQNMSERLKGVSFDDRYGKEKADALKKVISENLIERMKDPIYAANISTKINAYWAIEENRIAQSKRKTELLANNFGSYKTSKFENNVLNFLVENKIDFIHQFRISIVTLIKETKYCWRN